MMRDARMAAHGVWDGGPVAVPSRLCRRRRPRRSQLIISGRVVARHRAARWTEPSSATADKPYPVSPGLWALRRPVRLTNKAGPLVFPAVLGGIECQFLSIRRTGRRTAWGVSAAPARASIPPARQTRRQRYRPLTDPQILRDHCSFLAAGERPASLVPDPLEQRPALRGQPAALRVARTTCLPEGSAHVTAIKPRRDQ